VTHKLLLRQLAKAGCDESSPPTDPQAWRALLEHVDRAYTDADRERYTNERAMRLSSEEMRALHEQLRRERDQLEAIMRAIDEGVCAFDIDGRITMANEAAARILGREGWSLVGMSLSEVLDAETDKGPPPLSQPGGARRWLLSEVRCQRCEGRLFRPDGSARDFCGTGTRVETPDGGRSGVMTLHDVTERNRAEAAVRQSEQRLQLHVRKTPLAAIEMTSDCVISGWNPAAERIFGYSEAEAVGRHLHDLIVPPPLREEVEGIRLALISQDGGARSTNRNITKDGREIVCEWYNTPLIDDAGEVIGIASLAQDVTDRVRYEEGLEQARLAAEEANHAKSNFLANMSHEIRTPMTAILGFADLLADGVTNGEERRHALDTIRRNGAHLLDIINDILDISKIEEGRATIEQLRCSARRIIEDVAALMGNRAEHRGLFLAVDIDPGVPDMIVTDPTRLRQILTNLLANAVKFTETGGVRLRALMRDDPDARRLVVEVVDSGVGMSREQLSRIFQPFAQADASTTRRFGGTGLGLAISRRLARMLGGDIVAQSSPGEGSAFTLSVDAGLDRLHEAPDASDLAGPADAADPGQGKPLDGRVLLVEDGPDNQRLIAMFLRAAGATVVIADNGAEAVGAVHGAAHPFDLILMDMQMPVMDGYTAAARLREAGLEVPIVALTAHAMAGDRDRCIEAGCDDYISKPVKRAELVARCAAHLAQNRRRFAPER